MDYPVTELTPEQEARRRIVCSAVRDPTGRMWCGPRHAECLWQAFESIKDGYVVDTSDLKQGFVDQFFLFLTREEAWVVAERQGQVSRRVGGDGLRLYSENLY